MEEKLEFRKIESGEFKGHYKILKNGHHSGLVCTTKKCLSFCGQSASELRQIADFCEKRGE
jgi:hypothetical protein